MELPLFASALVILTLITILAILSLLKANRIQAQIGQLQSQLSQSHNQLESLSSQLNRELTEQYEKLSINLKEEVRDPVLSKLSQAGDASKTQLAEQASQLNQIQSELKDVLDKSTRWQEETIQALDKGFARLKSDLSKSVEINQSSLEQAIKTLSGSVAHHSLASALNGRLQSTQLVSGIMKSGNIIQEVDVTSFNVRKIIDNDDNTETSMKYDEDGKLSEAITTDNQVVLQRLIFDTNGQLKSGHTLDRKGQPVFDISYDEIGEITKRIDYKYDENKNLIDTQEVQY